MADSFSRKPVFVIPRQPVPAWQQLLILFAMVGLGFVLAGLASFVAVFSLDVPINQNATPEEGLNGFMVLNAVASIFLFALPALLFALYMSRRPAAYLGMQQPVSYKQILLVLLIAFASIYLSGMLAELNKVIPLSASLRKTMERIEKEYADQIMRMIKLNTWPQYLVSLLFVALVPAFVEELFFRASLQPVLHRLTGNPWAAIILTAIVFSLVHFSWYGFIPRAALGVVLGLIFYYSQSIWLSVLAHAFNNGLVVTVLFFLSRQGKLTPKSLDDNMAGQYVYLVGGLALIGVIALIREFRKQSLLAFAFYDESEEP